MIAETSLDEVRERTDIVEVVREFIPNLKRSGRNHKACCPFHQERTPSFMVNPDKQIFHCFGCHAGGDVFKFIMLYEGLSFPESVEKLAERAGVRVAATREPSSPQAEERARVRKVLELARDFYHAHLKKLPEDSPPQRYLKKRGLSPEVIESFGVGFAPRSGPLKAAAGKKGYPPELLAKAGLVADRQGMGYRDYFWDRILFPIDNPKGEIVGFGARTMGDGQPKYLNSPETVVFSKGRVLYGLKAALPAIRKAREALLLEGYMDVIAAHQFGVKNATAPLGTALTEEHAALLKRYADRVTVVFDPDAAGIKAALRGAEILLEKGLSVSIATLPDRLDPDDLLRQQGVEAFREALERASDLPAFMTEHLLRGKPPPTAAEKSRIAAEVLETIARTPDEILKSEWIRALGARLGVDELSLYHGLKKTGGSSTPRDRRRKPELRDGVERPSPLPVTERDILHYLFRSPALAVDDELVAESDLRDARARRILTALRTVLEEGEGVGEPAEGGDWTNRLLGILEPETATLARELLCDEREADDPAAILAEIVGRSRKMRRFAEIEPIVEGEGEGKPVDPEIKKEYIRLLSDLKGTRKGE